MEKKSPSHEFDCLTEILELKKKVSRLQREKTKMIEKISSQEKELEISISSTKLKMIELETENKKLKQKLEKDKRWTMRKVFMAQEDCNYLLKLVEQLKNEIGSIRKRLASKTKHLNADKNRELSSKNEDEQLLCGVLDLISDNLKKSLIYGDQSCDDFPLLISNSKTLVVSETPQKSDNLNGIENENVNDREKKTQSKKKHPGGLSRASTFFDLKTFLNDPKMLHTDFEMVGKEKLLLHQIFNSETQSPRYCSNFSPKNHKLSQSYSAHNLNGCKTKLINHTNSSFDKKVTFSRHKHDNKDSEYCTCETSGRRTESRFISTNNSHLQTKQNILNERGTKNLTSYVDKSFDFHEYRSCCNKADDKTEKLIRREGNMSTYQEFQDYEIRQNVKFEEAHIMPNNVLNYFEPIFFNN